MYSAQWTEYSVPCIVRSGQCTMYSAQWRVDSVPCIVRSGQCVTLCDNHLHIRLHLCMF